MQIEQYMRLLHDGKKVEAELIRISTIPDKLIKYVWLDGSESDKKKFKSLREDLIWFSHRRFLNDPYEFKGMMMDQQKMSDAGYPQDVIDTYQTLFDFSDYGITCLSANPIDYLPMWAYYTNNHKGFCIEYDVVKKGCVHEVLYEPKRIKVASLLFQYKDAVKEAIRSGKHTTGADFLGHMFLQNLYIKDESWKHEKEYRIVYPIGDEIGKNIPVSDLGMKTCRIVAGINCSKADFEKLNEISNALGLGNCFKSELHPETYGMVIEQ